MSKIIKLLSILILFSSCSEEKSSSNEKKKENVTDKKEFRSELDSLYDSAKFPFYHGVASGDPLQDAVIIWTRVTPKSVETITVNWKIAKDPEMKEIVKSGDTKTDIYKDFTIKIDVTGLEPGTTYYYQFESLKKKSEVGRTKTLPEIAKKLRLGFASCSNYSAGYFNAYRLIGEDSLDVVIHLGDYIYEYAPAADEGKIGNRVHLPAHEILTLEDYRTRYAQYRLDEDLKFAHAQHPFICVWDDHELANNAYEGGAQNHNEGEGDWKERVAFAKQAYYEWMPIRDNNGKHYRTFSFGNLADLMMLDTRTDGRTQQPGSVDVNAMDTSVHIINAEQKDLLITFLLNNPESKWKIIGNQILFSDIQVFFGKTPQLYTDGWSAYRSDHKLLAGLMDKASSVIMVTGDFHSSFAIKGNGYHEYVIPSITSTNYDEDYGKDSALIYEKWYREKNKTVDFTNLTDHGYLVLELSKAACFASFIYSKDIRTRNNEVNFGPKFGFRSFAFMNE